MLVKPGGVLISLITTSFSGVKNTSTRHACASQRLISLNGNRPDLIVDLWCNGCRNYHFRAIFVNVLGVVGIEVAGEYDLATGAGLRVVVAQNCAFDLTTFDPCSTITL